VRLFNFGRNPGTDSDMLPIVTLEPLNEAS